MLTARNKFYAVLIVAFVAALLLRTFFFEAFLVKGDSMTPAINDGELVFVSKLSYVLGGAPRRGDIIVGYPRELDRKILKRIVGLPGEIISIEGGRVLVRNERTDAGEVLAEEYLDGGITPVFGRSRINLDPKEYFALGDNREISVDSRELGPIDLWDIKGRVIASFSFKLWNFKAF